MEKLFMQQSKDDIAFQTMNAHEHLIQMLSSIQLQLHSLQALLRNDETQPDVAAIRNGLNAAEQLTQEAIYEIRSVNDDDLLLPNIYGDTLVEALSRAVEETAELLGLSSRITFSGEERPLPSYAERLIYRIAQEALEQIRQHSNARKLRFTFSYGREEIQMSLEDDGVLSTVNADEEFPIPHFQNDEAGASSAEEVPLPHFRAEELLSPYNALHHRLEHLGGSLEVTSQIEQGTRVQVRAPYSSPNAGVVSNGTAPNAANHAEETSPTIKVRVLIVDDQAVSRAGLRRLLESYSDLQVVGEAADGLQAVSETLELGPQVVLMDANLPSGQSIEALKQIKQLNLDTRVLLFAAQDREEYLYETLRAGADGYVLKDIVPDDLAQAVRVVASGEVLVQAQLAGRLLSRFGKQRRGSAPYETLTAREQEVLRLLARGLRNKEIATRLVVSERTVNFHLANIYQKLNVSGRTEALSKALEQGLIST
jgi:DNA-binding NarL/FixJ family response regulator